MFCCPLHYYYIQASCLPRLALEPPISSPAVAEAESPRAETSLQASPAAERPKAETKSQVRFGWSFLFCPIRLFLLLLLLLLSVFLLNQIELWRLHCRSRRLLAERETGKDHLRRSHPIRMGSQQQQQQHRRLKQHLASRLKTQARADWEACGCLCLALCSGLLR